MRFVIGVVVLSVIAVTVHATTYRWIDSNRPKIALADALKIGNKKLGDDRDRFYCIGAVPFGDQSGDGTNGYWAVEYASNDGSRKNLTVRMTGKAYLSDYNGPIDTTENAEQPTSLPEIEDRLIEVFESHRFTPYEVVKTDQKCIVLSYLTREYTIHELKDDGTYSENTQVKVGPKHNGVWLRVSIATKPDPKGSALYYSDPYWRRLEHNYELRKGERYIHVECRCGNDFPKPVIHQLVELFGERIEKW